MLDVDVNRIGDLRMAACGLSFTDQIGLVVQKGFGAAHALIKNESIDVLKFTMKSLSDERVNVSEWDGNRSDPMREQIYGLCEALEFILKYKIISANAELSCPNNKREILEDAIESGLPEAGRGGAAVSLHDNNDFEPQNVLGSGEFEQLMLPIEDAAEIAEDALENQHLAGVPKLEDALFDELATPFVDKVKHEYSIIEDNETFLDEMSMEEMEADENELELSTDDNNGEEDIGQKLHGLFEIMNNKKSAQVRKKSSKIERKDILSKLKKRRNMRTDEPRKQFQCDKCDRRFDRKDSVKRHMHLHSPKQSEKPFTCQSCGEGFAYYASLWKHTKKHSNDVTVRKPFACATCGTRFAEKHHLKRHAESASH